ncbi:hypothetical protein [Alteromonas sp. BMJM2]|uniref:hypothetical protein n=1 Tax=Alteromonas sp. BMJM2 TaxID=2954241 RepID=UPI0022B30529|nr:hypothetical protein [Alteromonas sp. BMJM2]
MKKNILLLTAAINTSREMKNNLRSSPELRISDYYNALDFYIHNLNENIDVILFCENTNADLSVFAPLKKNASAKKIDLQLHSFQGTCSPSLGKGRCEFEILDEANKYVEENYGENNNIWKITGRLIIENINSLINSRPSDSQLYIDLRSVPYIGEKLGGNKWADMRAFAYNSNFYKDFLMNSGQNFSSVVEKSLFQKIINERLLEKGTCPRLKVEPIFRGICGGSNKNYKSLEYRLKYIVRSVSRKLTPFVWL